MKYVLVLSFLYKKYKENNGKLSIQLNDRLIDIISLDEDITLRNVSYKCNISGRVQSWRTMLPNKLYYYEIDTDDLEHNHLNNLHIQAENDFNNYTNGFMTESSYVAFVDILFIPKQFFNIETISKLESRFKEKFWDKILPLIKQDHVNDTWLHCRYKKDSLDPKHGRWPYITWPLCYRTKTNELKKAHEKVNIGGSFSVELPIVKKHGIHMIREREFLGPPLSVGDSFVYDAIGHTQINNEKGPWINITVDKKNEDQ